MLEVGAEMSEELLRETTPQVFLIARPSLDLEGMRGYLESVGGESWLDRRVDEAGGQANPGEALEPVREQVVHLVEQLEEFQVSAAKELGIDEDGVPFHVKKEVTSALRRLAPIGLSTDIVWTANVRTLRHVIEMRTAPGAEEELRLVFDQIARIMKAEAPNLFQDFKRLDDGTWAPEFRKV